MTDREQLFIEFSHRVNPPLSQTGIRIAFEEGYSQGVASVAHRDAEKIGLPVAPFFYTLDQISSLLQVDERTLKSMMFYTGRSTGAPQRGKLIATNLAVEGETPVWRVLDRHFIQYLRFKKIKFHTPGM